MQHNTTNTQDGAGNDTVHTNYTEQQEQQQGELDSTIVVRSCMMINHHTEQHTDV